MLQAYDSHCNLVLGEVEETIYAVDDDGTSQPWSISLSCYLSQRSRNKYFHLRMQILLENGWVPLDRVGDCTLQVVSIHSQLSRDGGDEGGLTATAKSC